MTVSSDSIQQAVQDLALIRRSLERVRQHSTAAAGRAHDRALGVQLLIQVCALLLFFGAACMFAGVAQFFLDSSLLTWPLLTVALVCLCSTLYLRGLLKEPDDA